jgi:hypothetical protein
MLKDALEAAIKSDNAWAGRSALVLAVGILGEYASLPFLENRSWYRQAKIFFAVLVVAGIVGEYEFSSRIAQDAAELQRQSDNELSDAITKAGSADVRSKTLDTALQAAKLDLLNKQTALKKEQQKTARAQTEARKAQLALTKELEAVSKHQRPRAESFPIEQFAEFLKSKSKGQVVIMYAGDLGEEPSTFASLLQIGLWSGGWTAPPAMAIPADLPPAI